MPVTATSAFSTPRCGRRRLEIIWIRFPAGKRQASKPTPERYDASRDGLVTAYRNSGGDMSYRWTSACINQEFRTSAWGSAGAAFVRSRLLRTETTRMRPARTAKNKLYDIRPSIFMLLLPWHIGRLVAGSNGRTLPTSPVTDSPVTGGAEITVFDPKLSRNN